MASALQAFTDSDLGVATATSLHTLGALGFLGGVLAYVAWHRALRQGQDHPGLLRGAAFTTYLSIAANLLGGFLRTYESDHPRLSSFPTSPWVQAIAVKHLFLFTAMGAAVVLFERTVPRLRRAAAQGRLAEVSTAPHRVGTALVFTGIAVAALLGSVSQVVAMFPADPVQEPHAMEMARYQNFTGTLDGTPAAPAHGGGAFLVPGNATVLRFTVDAGGAPALRITLTEPDGTAHTVADGSVTLVDRPKPGAWRFDLDAPVGTGTGWSASVRITEAMSR
ncbi:MAG: hypothetical protein LC623_04510 [Halobacteriales archaeon]|nr:hypothetical protein [Halobacteriales archaeon]